MRRSRKMLVAATLLLVVSVIAPLFAGYCLTCTSGNCAYVDPNCVRGFQLGTLSGCNPCGPDMEGYYYCTDCLFKIYMCVKFVYGEVVQCSSPPYILVLEEERDFKGIRPYTCVEQGGRYVCKQVE